MIHQVRNNKKISDGRNTDVDMAEYFRVNILAEKRINEIKSAVSEYSEGSTATLYYISNHGDDKNDGKSKRYPKNTVNSLDGILKSGDTVLFERGGLWRQYFNTVSGVTYSAYGDGEKPRFYASPENGADADKWALVNGCGNVWIYHIELMDVGNIIFNDGELYGLKALPSYLNGVFTDKPTNKVFNEAVDLTENLMFFSKADSLFSNVDQPVERLNNTGKLYLRCDKGNPGEVFDSIEFLIRRNGIGLSGDNVIIDNLCVKYAGAHGMGGGTVGNITIRNCEVGWIGGGIQYYSNNGADITRYGNGIEIYGGCTGFTIDNCYVYDCYDAGITHQYQKGGTEAITENNISYKNNVIQRCAYNIEYFMGSVSSGNVDRIMRNIDISNNILRFAGKSFGARAHSVHIMGWNHRNEAYNFRIHDNIFSDCENRIFYIGASKKSWLPEFYGNTYFQSSDSQFALYGENDNLEELSYSENIKDIIRDKLGETDAKIFFINKLS